LDLRHSDPIAKPIDRQFGIFEITHLSSSSSTLYTQRSAIPDSGPHLFY
jgi:hypothetical protein